MKLSKNFNLTEFLHSDMAKFHNIVIEASKEQIEKLIDLCNYILQPCRDKLGVIRVNSGIRNNVLNKLLKGAKASQHLKGEAADISTDNNIELFNYIRLNLEFDQLIAEMKYDGQPLWIHVSYKKGFNRKQILVALKDNGKTVYLPYSESLFNSIYNV